MSAIFALPNHQEMLRLLKQAWDDRYAAERFYPLLIEYEGAEFTGSAFASWLMDNLELYVQNTSPFHAVIGIHFPSFIDALVDNAESKEEAHAELRRRLPAVYKDK